MQENKIKIVWYATASTRISAGDSQLLIDPFFPFPDSKIKVAPDAYSGCDNILLSHGHYDHIGSVKDIVRPNVSAYCTAAPYRTLLKKGVKKENLRLIRPGSKFRIGDFRITAYKGAHIKLTAAGCLKKLFSGRVLKNRKGLFGKLRKFSSCLEKKESLCYLIEARGARILILGSLALAPDVDYPVGVDVAFFPYQGSKELPKIAAEIYERLKPKAVLLTHFDDAFPPFSSEVDSSDFERYMKNRAPLYKLPHGDSLELRTRDAE